MAKNYELKIFIDKEKGRVLFAEADGDFVDRLFSFLTLPLVTVVRAIGKTSSEPTLGCFPSLIRSVASLGNEYFCTVQLKDTLLRPRSREIVYFSKDLKFIITDNLQVTLVVPGTILGSLNKLGTVGPNRIEERIVKLGLNELIEFVRCSLLSTAPLTDLFVSKTVKPVSSVKLGVQELIKFVKCTLLHTTPLTDLFGAKANPHLSFVPGAKTNPPLSFVPKKPSGNKSGRKINVKVVRKKSSKEFLFVEAGSDFIDFLFSLLLIPLEQMLKVMEGQSGLACIDGLYKSAQSLDSQHFVSQDRENGLFRPNLPPRITWENHLLPLDSNPLGESIGVWRKLPSGYSRSGGFMRKEAVFIVLDDLTVKPCSTAEAISIMNTHKTSFSDLEEQTLILGAAEGISILRASLNSTSAISNGLLGKNIAFFKEPKQEK